MSLEIIKDVAFNLEGQKTIPPEFLPLAKKEFAGGLYGLMGMAGIPLFKPLTYEVDIPRINEFFANMGINFDSRFLRDQYTDFMWTAGTPYLVESLFEPLIKMCVPKEGLLGVKKEILLKSSKAMSAIAVFSMAYFMEAYSATVDSAKTGVYAIDERDLIAYAAGIGVYFVSSHILENMTKQKAVEIDPQA